MISTGEDQKNDPALNLLLEHQAQIDGMQAYRNEEINKLQERAKEESENLKRNIEDFEGKLNSYREDLGKVNNWMVSVVIGVSVAFFLSMFAAYWSVITDKEIYLKYNDVYKSYSDLNLYQNDKVNNLQIEINNLKSELRSMRDKNPNLK